MGKKTKTGKARRDKFYHLAKESGFRARSAFKLTQLNKKFGFLQTAKVIIDLCAAPGGWLQVATEAAPVESLIVGVDLVPIRSIPRVTTLQEDITTDKCKQALKKELQTWKADCVLNDGAPNVGKSWVHDAFQQAELTLSALKLAVEFLRKGGWFVTKVFRSKDYEKLLWVFNQLFRDVKSTKPAASRTESAEIFVVCKGFIAPDKLDPRFLDPRHVFKDVEEESLQKIDLIHPEKKRRHRDGYAENDYTLHHPLSVSEFLSASNFQERLAESTEIILDDDDVANHPLTTIEIKECLKDIKVLGKKEIKAVFLWRKNMLKQLEKTSKNKETSSLEKTEDGEKEDSQDGESSADDDEAELNEKLASLKEEERRAVKRKLRKVRKEHAKLQHKMDTGMVIAGDEPEITDDINLFDLKRMNKKNLENLEEVDMVALDADLPGPMDNADSDEEMPLKRKWMQSYDRDSKAHLDDEMDSEEYEEEPDFDGQDAFDRPGTNEEGEEAEEEANPLLVELETREVKKQRNHNDWFSKDIFAGVDELEDMENAPTPSKKGKASRKAAKEEAVAKESESESNEEEEKDDEEEEKDDEEEENSDEEEEEDSDEDDSDEDDSSSDDEDYHKMSKQEPKKHSKKTKDDFEVVAAGEKLGPEGLAIASKMVTSRKRKRDMLDDGYHRYMYDDSDLPDWFIQDEKRHVNRPLPVTKGDIEEYRLKTKAIDAQPIKKIAEAKARKKHKALKKLERVRKKAETINDAVDTGDKEKWQEIKQLYKKAGLLKNQKKELTYVFAKPGTGKKVRRPAGVSGPFRVVDKRMKKDNMRKKSQAKAARKGGKKKGKKR